MTNVRSVDVQRIGIDDERWDALARGDLSPEGRAELEEAARRDPLAREAFALFEPLGAAAERRYAARIEAEIARRRRRGRARRWAQPVVAALAMAAGAALFLSRSGGDPALPAYAIAAAGIEERRGEHEEQAIAVAEGSRLVITLRPETPAAGPLAARVLLVQDGRVQSLDTAVTISPDGAVRCVATIGALRIGEARAVAIVGRPGAPFDPSAIDARQAVLSVPVRVIEAR